MKLALLLPGYLDSPDYLHMKVFENGLIDMGYEVVRVDPCYLWETGDVKNYTISNYINQIEEIIRSYTSKNPTEVVLIGHSLGGFVSIIAGKKIKDVTHIVSLCSQAEIGDQSDKWGNNGIRHSERDLPKNPKESRSFDIPRVFYDDAKQYSAMKDVKNIHKPIMIFIGQDDITVPPRETEKIVSNANNPYVVRQPGIGHGFRRSQKESEIVMNEIEKFLLK